MKDTNYQALEHELPGLKENVLLKDYTSFNIGGAARYFYIAETKQDIINALNAAKRFNLPFFILGGGTNLLVSDKGYEGIVIKIQNGSVLDIARQGSEDSGSEIISAGAGMLLSDLVQLSIKESLNGLEWAAGIPGTLGGAVRGNAGAFGGAMSDIVGSVMCINTDSVAIKEIENKDCRFSYKESIFKQQNNLIIVSVALELDRGEGGKARKQMREHMRLRKENQPLQFPSAGCIFKNPPDNPAGLLIDRAGLKGETIGRARVSPKHANFIINLGGAKAEDVMNLINLIKDRVNKESGIVLEEEIQYLGF